MYDGSSHFILHLNVCFIIHIFVSVHVIFQATDSEYLDLLGNSYVQTSVKRIYWVYFNFSLSWMTSFLPWPRIGNSLLHCHPGLLGSFYPVPIQRRNNSFPTSALCRHPGSSSQPLTESRTSSSVLTEALKPQIFPTRSLDMAAASWCGGSMKLPEAQAPLMFPLHHPQSMVFTLLVVLAGISSLKYPHSFCHMAATGCKEKLAEWVF